MFTSPVTLRGRHVRLEPRAALLQKGFILRVTKPAKRIGFFMFSAALVAIQVVVFFGSPPTSPQSAALTALISYFLFAGIAGWLAWRAARGARPA